MGEAQARPAATPKRRRRKRKRCARRRRLLRRDQACSVELPLTAVPARIAAGAGGERPAPLHFDWDPDGILRMLDAAAVAAPPELQPEDVPIDWAFWRPILEAQSGDPVEGTTDMEPPSPDETADDPSTRPTLVSRSALCPGTLNFSPAPNVPGHLHPIFEGVRHVPPSSVPIAKRGTHISFLPTVRNMCAAGIVRKVSTCRNSFALLTVPKPDGRFRIIYNMKTWTEHYALPKVVLPSPQDVLRVIGETTPWAVKIDLTDGFYHIPLSTSLSSWFGIVIGNRSWVFSRLPMGWAMSPLIMQTAMRAALRKLADPSTRIFVYYDDILLINDDPEVLAMDLRSVADAGFRFNVSKSVLAPTKRITYLGLRMDLEAGTVAADERYTAALAATPRVLLTNPRFARVVQGMLVWLTPATTCTYPLARLVTEEVNVRLLQRALKYIRPLQVNVRQDLQQQQLLRTFSSECDIVFYCDSSTTGRAFGNEYLGYVIQEHSITHHVIFHYEYLVVLETMFYCIFVLGLKTFIILSDNEAVVWLLQRRVCHTPQLYWFAHMLFIVCKMFKIVFLCKYVPSSQNKADGPSRSAGSRTPANHVFSRDWRGNASLRSRQAPQNASFWLAAVRSGRGCP